MPSMIELMQQLSEPITIRPVKSEADYVAALAEIEQLMGSVEPNTPEGDKFELLVTLVEIYENTHYPMGETSDPISMLEFVMEQRGMARKDLEPFIGPRQRVWEIMERRRPLSLAMIRRLEKGLNIPASLLVQEYPLQT
jgi:HTH-type transcriptional regulator / antitoxin HigA